MPPAVACGHSNTYIFTDIFHQFCLSRHLAALPTQNVARAASASKKLGAREEEEESPKFLFTDDTDATAAAMSDFRMVPEYRGSVRACVFDWAGNPAWRGLVLVGGGGGGGPVAETSDSFRPIFLGLKIFYYDRKSLVT